MADKLTVEYSGKDVIERMEKMEVTFTQLITKMNDGYDKKFEGLSITVDHAVNGNGNDGLKTRTTKIEQAWSNFKVELMLHRWVIGITLLLVGWIIMGKFA